MKNFTIISILLFFPFYSILNAQCFDLTSLDLEICEGDVVQLTLEISGGEAPYAVEWSSNFGTFNEIVTEQDGTLEIWVLESSLYSFTVTDNTGCQETTSSQVNYAPPIIVEANVTNLSVCGNCDGEVLLTVNGGVPPYTFLWSNGSIGIQGTGFCPGLVNVSITDAIGCTEFISVAISEPNAISLDFTASQLACMEDGFIQISDIQGGVPPYSYSLNGGPFTTETLFENLIAGIYNIAIMDGNNCIINYDINIQSEITLELTSSFANCDSMGGTVIVNNLQGTTDASFVWSNGDVGPESSNLAPGWYSVTVTDNETSCVTHQNIEVLYDPNCFVRISGRVLNDFEEEDCIEDEGSIAASSILVSLSNGDLAFPDATGYYEFETGPGIYEVSIEITNNLYDPLCIETLTVDVSNFGDNSTDNDFWITYSDIQDLAISVFHNAVRPGFNQRVIFYARNQGGFPMDGTVIFTHDPLQSFLGTMPTGTYDLANSTVSWDFEGLGPGEVRIFAIDLNLPPDVALGTPITYTATIGPEENDINLSNNIKEINLNVTGSYDPNDKQVTPRGEGETGDITRADSILTYQVRFQNTGTDTAFTVVVLDEIADELDITTVQPGPSSHPYRLNIIDGKTLEFRFEDILLPDSFVNEPASNGYVLFDIKTKKDLPYGTTFENTAAIFFDFNQPIITNTTLNTLASPVAVNDLETIFIPTEITPNPGGDQSVFIYSLAQPAIINIDLYDLNGKLLHHFINKKQVLSGTHQVNLGKVKLPKGVYFIHLETEEGGMAVRKWVKI